MARHWESTIRELFYSHHFPSTSSMAWEYERRPLNATDVTKNQSNTHPLWISTSMHLHSFCCINQRRGSWYHQLLHTRLALVWCPVNSRGPVRKPTSAQKQQKVSNTPSWPNPASIVVWLLGSSSWLITSVLWLKGYVAIAISFPYSHKVRIQIRT